MKVFLMQRFLDHAAQVLAICLVTSLFAYEVRAELRIDITKGVVEPIPIAVTDMVGPRASRPSLGRTSRLISEDLERSVCSSLLIARPSFKIAAISERYQGLEIGV